MGQRESSTPKPGKLGAILPILSQWYERAKLGSINVFNFPPNRRPARDRIRKLTKGSTCLLFAYDERRLVGEFKVNKVERLLWKEFQNAKERAFPSGEARFPKPNEWCWTIEFTDFRVYERPLDEEEVRKVFLEVLGKSASMRPLHFTQIIDEKLVDVIKIILLVLQFMKKD